MLVDGKNGVVENAEIGNAATIVGVSDCRIMY